MYNTIALLKSAIFVTLLTSETRLQSYAISRFLLFSRMLFFNNFSNRKFEVGVKKLFVKGPVELREGMNLTIGESIGSGMFATTFKGNFESAL